MKAKEEIVSKVMKGTHEQFVYNEEEEKVKCKCGHSAVWWRTGFICRTITAYPCKYN